jgi:hypothetical protein
VELETSLRRVRSIVTRSENFYEVTGLDHFDDYFPSPKNYYVKVGDGLMIYEPKGYCLEMHTAISADDIPDKPIEKLHEHWKMFADMGYHTIYAFAGHQRACAMCRAAGMKLFNRETNCYSKVIYGW